MVGVEMRGWGGWGMKFLMGCGGGVVIFNGVKPVQHCGTLTIEDPR